LWVSVLNELFVKSSKAKVGNTCERLATHIHVLWLSLQVLGKLIVVGRPRHEHKLAFVLEQSETVSWPSVALLGIV
jgi:hypothetical protein